MDYIRVIKIKFLIVIINVWFQKTSIPPPWRELEFPKGRGVKDPGNSRGKGGCMMDLVSRGPLI